MIWTTHITSQLHGTKEAIVLIATIFQQAWLLAQYLAGSFRLL